MIVCYFGTYREEYSRNRIMLAALESAGVTVKQCHASLWHDIEDRVNITLGGWKKPAFWWRLVRIYSQLLWRYLKVGKYDVMLVGYPGQFDVYLARILTQLKHKPLVWDVFMSLYLVAKERELDRQNKSSVNLLRRIEERALQKPDLLLQDTAEYVKWFSREYGISADRFRLIPTGADDRIFRPITVPQKKDDRFHVLYYGSFIPNHGVMRIAEAAEFLSEEKDIIFDMIGNGPERKLVEDFVQERSLANVRFFDWMDQQALVERINAADVCLGAFGFTPQSLMTVQNKIYECMAAGKAVITGDSPAVRDVFAHKQHLYICKRTALSLMNAIQELKNDHNLLNSLGNAGHGLYKENFSIEKSGQVLTEYLDHTKP